MVLSWRDAVEGAVRRHVARSGNTEFTRQDLIAEELDQIVADTGSSGATPEMTLSRELQEWRDRGGIEFVHDRGSYRLIG